MNNCTSHDNCINRKRNTLRHPMDQRSLYADRIYDDHTAVKRCYESSPFDIIEGFGGLSFNKLLKWAIIILVVYLLIQVVMNQDTEEVSIGVPELAGGTTDSLTDFAFLNTTE